MRSKHKNIDMSGGHLCTVTHVNILAFFSVVASSQISPHLLTLSNVVSTYSAAKIHKKTDIPNPAIFNALKLSKSFLMSVNCIIFAG